MWLKKRRFNTILRENAAGQADTTGHKGLDPAGERRGTGGHEGKIKLKEQNARDKGTKK